MSELLRTAEDKLIAALSHAARGPTRNDLFALWLVVRACDGLFPPDALTPRAHRRRLEALERRLTSLSLTPGMRRRLHKCVQELKLAQADAALTALQHLAHSVREPLGPEAAEALAAGVQAASTSVPPGARRPTRDR